MLYIFLEMSSRISEYSLNNQCIHFSPSAMECPTLLPIYNMVLVPTVYYIRTWYIFGGGFNLANHVNIAKLNVHYLYYKHGLLCIQYSKTPIKSHANHIFRGNCQIFDSPIIPHTQYI